MWYQKRKKKLCNITTYPTKVNMPIPSSKRKVNSKICQNSTGWLLKFRLKIQQVAYISLQLIKFECCNSSVGNTIEIWAKFAYHMISQSLTFLIWWYHKNPLILLIFFILKRHFRSKCSERNERRGAKSGAKAGVPSGVAEAEDWATRSEWSERNERRKCLFKIKKISNIK